MKKIINICCIILFTFSCKAQDKVIETKSKDVLIFKFKSDNIQLAKFYSKVHNEDNSYKKTIESSENKEIYNNSNIIIITQEWQGYGSHYFDKEYSFVLAKDTMNIKCKCGQNKKYFFKNLEFKKGNYELIFEYPKKYNDSTKKIESLIIYVKGKQIRTPKKGQDILFKNTYVSHINSTLQDTYFKDLKFIEIDLKDTINVKLKLIE